ncbi:GIY-YIG nuclease family protein [Aestuariivivens sediminicola]|uniref:GIY-YIG nuclease family protein n=1 Tax=Aestuariivivens sediminicola TaxID=2913560 RepID=UPI001F568B91|nr:GIY-YIG nuclease family protein [Aestuariivivens sediminicola]
MFYTYIIESEQDGSFYIGYTEHLDKRISEHNMGLSAYTKKKTPWKIVYVEAFTTKREAILREKFLKRQKNRNFYLRLIENNRSGSSVG